ncbi:unnamed protein product [Schistosoma margrebowiei]|uniref:Uncharacterized protein n=1 Tax=Schistosoma margrebowiei TaxID=48269 RepID=A0A183M9J3_9TREM|nr:unnamed protein product [Schistosoma margrebowiei]
MRTETSTGNDINVFKFLPFKNNRRSFSDEFIHFEDVKCRSSHILMGACSGFLTESIDGLLDDAYLLRPTSLVVVPRVLSRMYTKYQSALGDSVVKKKLYNYIVKKKLAEQERYVFLFFKNILENQYSKAFTIVKQGYTHLNFHKIDQTNTDCMEFSKCVLSV